MAQDVFLYRNLLRAFLYKPIDMAVHTGVRIRIIQGNIESVILLFKA